MMWLICVQLTGTSMSERTTNWNLEVEFIGFSCICYYMQQEINIVHCSHY